MMTDLGVVPLDGAGGAVLLERALRHPREDARHRVDAALGLKSEENSADLDISSLKITCNTYSIHRARSKSNTLVNR
jgi:hypothetical protein